MSSAASFRTLTALLVGVVVAFVFPAFGDQPQERSIDIQVTEIDGSSNILVEDVRVRPDTTLINDVNPPRKADDEPIPSLEDDQPSPSGQRSLWESFPDPRQANGHPGFSDAAPSDVVRSEERRHSKPYLFDGESVFSPHSHSGFGPCGCEFSSPTVYWPPQQQVYGDVFRLIGSPGFQPVAACGDHAQISFGPLANHNTVCASCGRDGLPAAVDGCLACQHARAARANTAGVTKPESDFRVSEAVEVILSLIDGVGPSVLNGTLYEDDSESSLGPHCDGAAHSQQARELVAQWIRKLEAEHPRVSAPPRQYHPVSHDEPHHVVVKQVKKPTETVHVLRHAACALDEAAAWLEQQDLYQRADQLRGLAQQLRHDGRGSEAASRQRRAYLVHPPVPPRPSGSEWEAEWERLRHELERTRDALREQQGGVRR